MHDRIYRDDEEVADTARHFKRRNEKVLVTVHHQASKSGGCHGWIANVTETKITVRCIHPDYDLGVEEIPLSDIAAIRAH